MIPGIDIFKVIRDVKGIKLNLIAIILYAVFTIILTYPIIMHMRTGLDLGDPALNAWILAWDVHSILTDPINLFNTNIFYPLTHNNLAFSENLFADMLFAFPIIAITENVILAYNTIFILSFVLSGFGVFLLVNYYLNDKYSAFLAGFAFAFCAFRFSHLGHLQLLTAQWIPFSILYLDKFIHNNSYKNMVVFYFFYLLQILSCWYYAFYLTFSLGLYAIHIFIINSEFRKKTLARSFKIKIAIFIMLTAATLAPFAIPYFQTANEYGAVRSLAEVSGNSADIADYLLAPPFNALYGKIYPPIIANRQWWEHSLFPGGLAIILALYGFLCISRSNINEHYCLEYTGNTTQNFYLILSVFAFILSLGTALHFFGHTINIHLPYNYFYEYVPGFKSMRAPVRWGVLVSFSFSILAGYGLNKLIRFRSCVQKSLVFIFCMSFILLESIYIPIGIGITPLGQDIPDVYKWLSNDSGDFAIVELPMIYVDQVQTGTDLYKNTRYMYYSTYHWKNLVNGYSGYTPDYHLEIIHLLKTFPSNESINLLQHLGVKYVIVHRGEIGASMWNSINGNVENYQDRLKLKKVFNQDYVYEIDLTNRPSSLKSTIQFAVHVPTKMQKSNHYYGSIELINKDTHDYIFDPIEKLSANFMLNSTTRGTYVKNYQILLPFMVKAKTNLSIPFVIDTPDWEGNYTMKLIISNPKWSKKESFYADIILTKDLLDSESSDKVRGDLIAVELPMQIRTEEPFKIDLIAKNTGSVLWRSKVFASKSSGVVSVGSKWFKDGREAWKSGRGYLPFDVAPGQNVTFIMDIVAPDLPGNYTLELDLVDELITWFNSNGGKTIKKNLTVLLSTSSQGEITAS